MFVIYDVSNIKLGAGFATWGADIFRRAANIKTLRRRFDVKSAEVQRLIDP
jgi:hypothetical protein